jgi:putative zinc finger protein
MTHPEELLAGYVDGTLSAQERAAVESHVAGCARCSREIELATSARSALRSLPEVPAPAGIGSPAIEEASGSRAASATEGTPRWYRVGGLVAAVAAGLLVFTLVLPHVGQNSSDDGGNQRAAGASERDTQAGKLFAASGIEIQHENYDNSSLTALITSLAAEDSSAGGGAASAPQALATGSQAQVNEALACIVQSAPGETGDLQRLIRARFEGTPAYLALFTEGPGAGQPADRAIIWVFATDDCRILSSSLAQL